MTTQTPPRRELAARARRSLVLAIVVGTGLGTLTSWGQLWLPAAWTPLANSSGSWCLVAFALAALQPSRSRAALAGFVTLATLLLGYCLASELRGFHAGTGLIVFWTAAALVVGPVLGAAAHATRHAGARLAAVGAGVMGGLLVGEGVYGLTVVDESTQPHWWVTSIVLGVVVPAVLLGRRRAGARAALLCATTIAVVAAAFWFGYQTNLIAVL